MMVSCFGYHFLITINILRTSVALSLAKNSCSSEKLSQTIYSLKRRMIIAVIHATFAVAKRKTEENSGLYGIRTLDLSDTGAGVQRFIAEVKSSNPVQA